MKGNEEESEAVQSVLEGCQAAAGRMDGGREDQLGSFAASLVRGGGGLACRPGCGKDNGRK